MCTFSYFHEDATQEILDEFRPLMCPFDITMIRATFFFELLLPTNLPPESHHKGFKLWLGEFIGIWESCQNNPSWEGVSVDSSQNYEKLIEICSLVPFCIIIP